MEKRPAEEPTASTSAMPSDQNNAGVDKGQKSLVEILMAGFGTLNKSIASLRQQDEPTADPGEVDADSSEYSNNNIHHPAYLSPSYPSPTNFGHQHPSGHTVLIHSFHMPKPSNTL